ncbi:MAG TPA: hypothetical protein RMH85_03095 [Polyangiaceae bacterium LLY-WYZ-15_(1-7)]|nr:hypothetical protein [Myxococcales bacterium]MAT28977.1 hypothetical protein [Sandaracinus sp.]HJK92371.1 hypothetical protein [Polyangiaceae bacterium LLY-WYZ-15_(1-7)]HJL05256.1 hypothetical protein [Polyangiaceae bacterium LLY-WYZ-15_(1-7)]HJL07450.1 hypothetical protein [Polyangiaceae bacterium LLY-WYZ-15_(1-7)]
MEEELRARLEAEGFSVEPGGDSPEAFQERLPAPFARGTVSTPGWIARGRLASGAEAVVVVYRGRATSQNRTTYPMRRQLLARHPGLRGEAQVAPTMRRLMMAQRSWIARAFLGLLYGTLVVLLSPVLVFLWLAQRGKKERLRFGRRFDREFGVWKPVEAESPLTEPVRAVLLASGLRETLHFEPGLVRVSNVTAARVGPLLAHMDALVRAAAPATYR